MTCQIQPSGAALFTRGIARLRSTALTVSVGRASFTPSIVMALALATLPPTASAQPASQSNWPSRVELWGGATGDGLGLSSGTVETAFGVLFWGSSSPLAPSADNTGGQTLVVEGKRSTGAELGVSWLLNEHLGLQAFVNTNRFDVGGTNTPYTVHVANWPAVSSQTAWPDTNGTMRQTSAALDAVARWRVGPRLLASVSGGVTIHTIRGEVQSLGFSRVDALCSPGGRVCDAVARSWKVAYEVHSEWAAAINVGTGVDLELARHLAVTADVRWIFARSVRPTIEPSQIIAATTWRPGVEGPSQAEPGDLTDIGRSWVPPETAFKPNRFRVMVGLKYRR
jgi:hypothetical protein